MTKKKNCKICKKYSGKRNVCLDCKTKYPYIVSQKGKKPFNRMREFEKNEQNK